VVLVCDDSLRDLRALRRKTHYRAPRGAAGRGALRHGADGAPLLIGVPPGTQAEAEEGGIAGRRWDLLRDGERAVVAAGGAGGRGNKRFASPTRQAPHFAERGLPGEEGWLALALKLLADVGLVGLPNAGKSSLLARMTRATPKVASYPFTTLEPVLGVLERDDRQLVIADIPGLIEGASSGAGLGDEFLAHIERTQLLVHVLELAPELSTAPAAGAGDEGASTLLSNYDLIERELLLHDQRLARLPRVLALSKADLVPPERAQQAAAELSRLVGSSLPVIVTSSATGAGLSQLAGELLARVAASEELVSAQGPAAGESEEVLAEHMVFRPVGRAGYEVTRVRPGVFSVAGERVERLIQRFDLENDEALAYVEAALRRRGVLSALRSKGFQPGNEIRIGGEPLALFASAPA
jgi:GTP-binding protein